MYRYEISRHDIKLVKEALKILTDLKAPISKNITFGYTSTDKSYIGICKYRDSRYYVLIYPDFANDYYKIGTIIHEILHTINNGWDTPHRGKWARWAKIVSDSTPYKIKTNGEFGEIKYDADKNIPDIVDKKKSSVKAYCPCCDKAYDIPRNGKNYWCPKCFKPLSVTPLNDDFSKLSIKDRQKEILRIMPNISIECAPKLLLYSNRSNTKRIIINLMSKYPLDNSLRDLIKPYVNTNIQHRITELCKKGAFNRLIISNDIIRNYYDVTDRGVNLYELLWRS